MTLDRAIYAGFIYNYCERLENIKTDNIASKPNQFWTILQNYDMFVE